MKQKLKNILGLTVIFIVLVPLCAVIVERDTKQFVQWIYKMAGPYLLLVLYELAQRKKATK